MFESEIFNQQIYISIFVILGIIALFGVVKRLFKLLWSLLVVFILFLIFILITDQNLPSGIDDILNYVNTIKDNFVNNFKEETSKVIKENSEQIIDSIINQ